jgi:hypothetical protein
VFSLGCFHFAAHSHPAFAEFFKDLVMGNGLTDHFSEIVTGVLSSDSSKELYIEWQVVSSSKPALATEQAPA